MISIFTLYQVVSYGMNSKVGNVSFQMPQEGETTFEKPYSEATAKMLVTLQAAMLCPLQ